MYALYREQIEGEFGSLLGVWAIKVNKTDISSGGQDLTFNITEEDVEYIESDYIKNGKIAPGGQATFDIEIDPTNTDVSIVYQIDVGTSDVISNAKIELKSINNYFQKDGEIDKITNETVYQDGNTYRAVIPISQITEGYKNHVTLCFEWVNVEENNENDSTLASAEEAVLSVPLNINLKQYTGEVISNE